MTAQNKEKLDFCKELYTLKAGEMFSMNSHSNWLRVPGGWVYGDMQGTCFIPWNNEFQPPVDYKKPDSNFRDAGGNKI